MAVNLDNLRKLRAYIDALILAEEVLAESAPVATEAVVPDLAAWKTAQANRVLASSGDKAAMLGTLSTAPVVDAKALEGLSMSATLAAEAVKRRDELRASALALTFAPKVVEAVEK